MGLYGVKSVPKSFNGNFKPLTEYRIIDGKSKNIFLLRRYFMQSQIRLHPYKFEWHANSLSNECLRKINACLDNLFEDFTFIQKYSIDPDTGKIFFRYKSDMLAFRLALDENWFKIRGL